MQFQLSDCSRKKPVDRAASALESWPRVPSAAHCFVARSIGRIWNDPVEQQASIQGPCCDRSRQSATLSSAQAELAWVLHRADGPLLRHSRRLGWTLPKSASRPSTSSPCAIAYLQTIASAFGAIADVAGLAAGSPVWRLTLNEHAAPGFTRFARAW
jgi:hypothetical protein